MWKQVISNALLSNNPGVMTDVDCSLFTGCGSCIAQEGCGYCGNSGQCVSGGWFGALDKSTCGLNDYYYHQCHLSTLPLGIITIVLTSIIIISVLIGVGIFCCCLCCSCCQDNDIEEDEDRPLLNNKYQRRSSTFYQWNRQPIENQQIKRTITQENIATTSDAVAVDDDTNEQKWKNRREKLLQKYANNNCSNE